MSQDFRRILDKILPFIGMGIMVVLIIVGLVVALYVVFWGGIIGLIIFAIVYVKNKLFPPKYPQAPTREGRTFDNEE